MLYVIAWWAVVQILGLAALPLAFRLFHRLPDRGYALAKPLGLLLTTYLFWLLAMLGLLRNTWASMVFCLAAVSGTALYVYCRARPAGGKPEGLGDFLRGNGRLVLATELLFLLGFALWALFRAYNPEISATEKPMEFAFLNGILRSERFPPLDPWLSGYAISYYYFGYLMIAVLTRLSGVPPAVAFNLGIALLFAFTLTGAFSVVYNLVAALRPSKGGRGEARGQGTAVGFGLLGAWGVAIAGNLEGLFEVLHTRGLGPEAFWRWLDIKNLAAAPVSGQWYPTDNWWWWRASRVIHDRDLLGNSVEVIDEFPFFSFLLGDMHPHVLALPFVLLVIGLAFNLLRACDQNPGAVPEDHEAGFIRSVFGEEGWVLVLYAVCIGALGFLNTWDLPIYFVVVLGALAMRRWHEHRTGWLADVLSTGLMLALLTLALYIPFYIGFQSQAGGILPTLLFSTRLHQYLIMFGLPLFLLIGFVVVQWDSLRRRLAPDQRRQMVRNALSLWWGVLVFAVTGMLATLLPLFLTPRGRDFLEGIRRSEAVQQVIGDQPWSELLIQLLVRKLTGSWTAVLLALLLAVIAALLLTALRVRRTGEAQAAAHQAGEPPSPQAAGLPLDLSTVFALWLALVGLALTFVVEFVYLRDTFGTRMNTVFKFYYQAWVLLALSGAYGCHYVMRSTPAGRQGRPYGWLRSVWLGGAVLLFLASAIYPSLASYNKAAEFRGEPTLDGTAFMARYSPDDHAAIQWLNEHVEGAPVILEATGGSYSEYARVSAQTGLPTVLGWGGHELQWRGNYDEAGKREPDIDDIYGSLDPRLTLTLLDRYGIRYVYVGVLERRDYPSAALAKFDELLDVVYRKGQVTIYERRR